jgi:hypothetical protein
MLEFNPQWRFKSLDDGDLKYRAIPSAALDGFQNIISKIATQGDRWDVLETFKYAFAKSSGNSCVTSSSESWAETDMNRLMLQAAENAPLFLEAFYDACKDLTKRNVAVPDVQMLNQVCEDHGVGYIYEPPRLVLRDSKGSVVKTAVVHVVEKPKTLAESALESFYKSLERSDDLLRGGRNREAVQETLWVLESVSTAFRGVDTSAGSVKGKYFNDIVSDLKKSSKGTTLGFALNGMTQIHGYLSSPTGGGVRHGQDVSEGIPLNPSEARLFCNLIRSYVGYLLNEHERLVTQNSKSL